jgi:hypothetical protein
MLRRNQITKHKRQMEIYDKQFIATFMAVIAKT